MIVITVLGTSAESTEDQLQALTKDLLTLCDVRYRRGGYIVFPVDRMQMELGTEIVAQVAGVPLNLEGDTFGEFVSDVLGRHFPGGTKTGVQIIEARTVRELKPKS